MINLLKEVARGKRGARDLNEEESRQAAEWILTRKATPAQIGAFFIAERIKMESVEELEAFVTALRKHADRVKIPGGLDCAGPYDGRKKTFMATFPTAFVLAAAGLPVTLHSAPSLPPKWGTTLLDLLKEMGIEADRLSREAILRVAEATRVLFVPTERWCPPLHDLRPIREELGMRTVLNTAEKMIDFAGSPYIVFGVYHNTVFERISKLLQNLQYKKAIVIQGPEGSEDMFIDRPTRTYIVDGEQPRLHMVRPDEYGLETPLPDQEKEWTAADQLRVAEEVLRGESHMAFTNQVMLGGAVRLHLAGKVGSVEEGVYTCKSLLESGAALEVYRIWRGAMLGKEQLI